MKSFHKRLTPSTVLSVCFNFMILLMGPPGIGKTQIMEQIARECEISLVAYTITHHTRQSAVGLPFIEKKCYGGREYSVDVYKRQPDNIL